jgi:hypothetical protein
MKPYFSFQFIAIFNICCLALGPAFSHAFVHVLPLARRTTTTTSPSIRSMDTLNNHEINIEALVDEAAAAVRSEPAPGQGVLDNGVSQLIDEDKEEDMQTEMDRKHMNLAIEMVHSR